MQAKNDEERSAIMAKGNMTIRMEPELKAQAAALFKSLCQPFFKIFSPVMKVFYFSFDEAAERR